MSKSESNDESTSVAQPVYKLNKINFKRCDISELNKTGIQPIAYVNYEDPDLNTQVKLIGQTEKIIMVSHGIPPLDKPDAPKPFYPTDDKRAFIKVPLDNEQKSCNNLRKHLEKGDNYFGSNTVKKKLFGKNADKYVYSPMIKSPAPPENPKKDKNGNEYPIYDFVKMKLNYIKEKNLNKTVLKKVVDKKKVTVEAKTVTEVANEISYRSEAKFLFYYCKIWANTTPPLGSKLIPYGVCLKAMKIEYTPSAKNGINVDEIDFDSDDDDEDEVDEVETKKSSKKSSKANTSLNFDSDDENDDDNDEDEDDEPEPPKKKSKDKKKPSKKAADSDDEEDDEDEDDEPEPPKKKSKDKKKSSKKVVDSDDEEDEDDEEEEEVVKPKKKSKDKKKYR